MGYQGTGQYGAYTGGELNTLAYVTGQGSVQIMNVDSGIQLSQINEDILERGLGGMGYASPASYELTGTPMSLPSSMTAEHMSTNMVLADLHNNITSMGGFYGWMSSWFVEPGDEHAPRMSHSTRAFGYQRGFWDKELGNFGGEAAETPSFPRPRFS